MRTMLSCISDPRNLRAHLEMHRQMQPLQLCTVSNRKLEDADENAQWEKLILCNQCDYMSTLIQVHRDTLKKIQWRKVKQM